MTAEYVTLGLYFIILIAIGLLLSRQNKNLSDYVRGGAQGVWWLVGTSILMSGISAFTFTGNASAAFDAGPTMLVIYLANIVAYFLAWKWLAARFRRTRAYTQADIARDRFGITIEQFNVYSNLFLAPVLSAIQLWALSVFASSVFNLPLQWTIVGIGCVVVFYSTSGGKWAVMATDFVQSLIMIPITILIAVLAIHHIGGFGEFFSYFSDPRFASDFKFVKEPGQFADNKFTWHWIIVIFLMQLNNGISAGGAVRFFAAKDEKNASRAALLAGILMGVGMIIWFLPPMVARFMYENEVMSMGVDNPANASYAFIAMKVLPEGMVGILIAAMFSATMSSMDTGLNTQTGTIVRNLVPRLREATGRQPMTDKANILMCKIVTIILGIIIVTYALMLSGQKEFKLFDAFLTISSVIGLPIGLPILVALYVKKIPYWSYFVIFMACLVPSIWSFIDASVNDNAWSIQDRSMWIFIACGISVLICMPFYKLSTPRYFKMVEDFFTRMHTPIDYAKEVGVSKDYDQLYMMGNTCVAAAGLLCLLFIGVSAFWEILCVLFMVGFVGVVGLLLRKGAAVEKRKAAALEAKVMDAGK